MDLDRLQVIGVWFYEEEEARKVAMLLHRITEQYRAAGSSGTTTSEVCLKSVCQGKGTPKDPCSA